MNLVPNKPFESIAKAEAKRKVVRQAERTRCIVEFEKIVREVRLDWMDHKIASAAQSFDEILKRTREMKL